VHYVKTCPAWTTERQACDPARHPTSLRLVQRQNIWGYGSASLKKNRTAALNGCVTIVPYKITAVSRLIRQ
jgi:hypothetical protein